MTVTHGRPDGAPAAAAPRLDDGFATHLDARRPARFTHGLAGHPLLGIDAIAELAESLGADGISADNAVKPLVDPGYVSLAVEGVGDRIRSLASSDSWFTLLNIERHPRYAALIDGMVDRIAADADLPPASLWNRWGFVFASSPGSITSAHFDVEHSLLFQLEGRRTLSFGRFGDADVREHEVERYWRGESFGRVEAMPEHVADLELAPGVGAYIPPYVPHWLVNGDAASLSLTITFYTRSNADEIDVQVVNHRLRRLGLHPAPYGRSRGRDRAKAAAMRGYRGARRWLRGAPAPTSSSH
jgi:hypothetical protein